MWCVYMNVRPQTQCYPVLPVYGICCVYMSVRLQQPPTQWYQCVVYAVFTWVLLQPQRQHCPVVLSVHDENDERVHAMFTAICQRNKPVFNSSLYCKANAKVKQLHSDCPALCRRARMELHWHQDSSAARYLSYTCKMVLESTWSMQCSSLQK